LKLDDGKSVRFLVAESEKEREIADATAKAEKEKRTQDKAEIKAEAAEKKA